MKNVLIIYPHWPPSNLAGIHRSRLIANFLTEFNWQPVVLTVKPEYYEEPHDQDICKTVSDKIIVKYVDARPVPKIRFFGDIALRAFNNLYKGALKIINQQKIDFIWIPIPSFYTALLGRKIYKKTKIPYGIDYIDPWVNGFANQEKLFSRAWISNQMAKILEPYAVKNAALISGVSTSYYQGVLDRNFKNKTIRHVGMPYGFDPNDHKIELKNIEYPWQEIKNCKPLVYAGAFLPKSHLFVQQLFSAIAELKQKNNWDKDIHLFFVGTGNYAGKSIQDYAKEYKIDSFVHEINKRFPFLQILNFLAKSFGVMIIGSTEKHYTASKTFQSLLSGRPVFAIFHRESSAVEVMKNACADKYLVAWHKEMDNENLHLQIKNTLEDFMHQKKQWQPKLSALDKYSARESAKALVEKLNEIVE